MKIGFSFIIELRLISIENCKGKLILKANAWGFELMKKEQGIFVFFLFYNGQAKNELGFSIRGENDVFYKSGLIDFYLIFNPF